MSAVCLLSGTLFPVLDRLHQLAVQKALLLSHSSRHSQLDHELARMLRSIVAELGERPTPTEPQPAVAASDQAVRPLPRPHPLLRFRKAVIAVLAVIHLRALSKESTLLFTTSSAHHRLLPVSVGGRPGRTAKTPARGPHPLPTSCDLGAWLRSRRVMRAVREGMREIQRAMEMSQSTIAGISGSSHEQTQHTATLTELPV